MTLSHITFPGRKGAKGNSAKWKRTNKGLLAKSRKYNGTKNAQEKESFGCGHYYHTRIWTCFLIFSISFPFSYLSAYFLIILFSTQYISLPTFPVKKAS